MPRKHKQRVKSSTSEKEEVEESKNEVGERSLSPHNPQSLSPRKMEEPQEE